MSDKVSTEGIGSDPQKMNVGQKKAYEGLCETHHLILYFIINLILH